MKISFKKISRFLLLCGILFPAIVHAQPSQRNDRSIFYEYGESFYSEAHAMASSSADSSKIFVYFKIAYDAMSFTSASDQKAGGFKSSPTISVECRDDIGIIRQRAEWTRDVYAEKFDETNSKTRFVYGALELSVPPGKYTVTLEATDQSKAVMKRAKMPPVNAQSFLKTATHSDIQFAWPPPSEPSRVIRPFALGGNVPFSSGGFRALAAISGHDDSDIYTYVVSQAKTTETDNVWGKVNDIVGQVRPLSGDIIKLSGNLSLTAIELEMTPAVVQSQSAPSGNLTGTVQNTGNVPGLLDVTVPGESLVPGRYVMQLYKQGGRDTITQNFDVIWDNMPLSLRNSRYAAESMYYILTDQEHEQLLRGSDAEVKVKVFAYWRKNDPTPQTAFNQDLAAYFHRVDYAFFNFQTIEERDGAKTERGKVYILHGKPTSINRTYDPGKPVTERWRYEKNIKKEFVFEAVTEGRFKLKEVVEITQK